MSIFRATSLFPLEMFLSLSYILVDSSGINVILLVVVNGALVSTFILVLYLFWYITTWSAYHDILLLDSMQNVYFNHKEDLFHYPFKSVAFAAIFRGT